jgi:alpha-beta hydrolase superfamily lysophospholipase
MTLRVRLILGAGALAWLAFSAVALAVLPGMGAGGLLHPARHRVTRAAPDGCRDEMFTGAGVALAGWRCHATGPRRGTVISLHGVADTRVSAVGTIERFGARGFDVIAYDSRAHGNSGGDACTYGFFEKQDLHDVVDTIEQVPSNPVILIGQSLGGAVALQEAAHDPRVRAVVAAETFSDLRTVATERAPFVFTGWILRRAFQVANEQGHFDVDDVSPERAAATITVPVLLIHGATDVDTPPDHSRRIFAALKGPKRLIIVPGAAHNQSLRAEVWKEIENWIDQTVSYRSR